MNWNTFVLDVDLSSLLVRQLIQVTVLIVVVGSVAKLFLANRPRLAHSLWALVLLKCLTPPVVASPISPFSWRVQRTELSPEVRSNIRFAAVEVASQDQPSDSLVAPKMHAKHWSPIDADSSVLPLPAKQLVKESTESSHQSTKATHSGPATSKRSYVSFAVMIWLLGSVAALVLVCVRLCRFLRGVRRDRVEPREHTMRLLHETAGEMKLSGKRFRKVRLRAVDNLIGPAVIGFWRPTILLPRVIEDESDPSELKILLAHELIHIQRSDLCWALIQTLASCLWWFHPLMWGVRQTFNRVTELSCDEEVIERLECKPSEYARALLMVLERKHQLRVAPALPGVRPVEITSQRMERVMKLDASKNANRPWVIALLWLAGAMLVLPGAGWVVAEDDSISKPQTANPPNAVGNAWAKRPGPTVSTDSTTDSSVMPQQLTVRRYPANAAIAKIRSEDECTEQQAANILNASLDNVAGRGGKVIVSENEVLVRASKTGHQAVLAELKRITKYGFAEQTVITTRLCSMSKPLFDRLQIVWKLEQTEGKQKPLVTAMLDHEGMAAAMQLIQSDTEGNIMMAPKVTTFNGQKADIETGVQRPFVVTGNPQPNVGRNNLTGSWIGRLEFEGMRLSVRPTREGETTQLEIGVALSKIKEVNDFTFSVSKDKTMTVQVPDVIEQSARISKLIPKDQTIAIGMPSAETPDQVIVCFVSPEAIVESNLHPAVTVPQAAIPQVSVPNAVQPAAYNAIQNKPIPQPQRTHASTRSEPSLDTWLLKADGGATPVEIRKQADKLLLPFDAKSRMEGDWRFSRDGDTAKLSGKNLSVSSLGGGDETTEMRCESGNISFGLNTPSMAFQADAEACWEVAMKDMGVRVQAERFAIEGGDEWWATGGPVKFELTLEDVGKIRGQANQFAIGNDGLRIEGEVQFVVSGKTLKADRAEFEDETVVLLRGDVHLTSNDEKKSAEIRCEGLRIDLVTSEIQLLE